MDTQKTYLGQFGCRVLENGFSSPPNESYNIIRIIKKASFTADNNTIGGDTSITISQGDSGVDINGNFHKYKLHTRHYNLLFV